MRQQAARREAGIEGRRSKLSQLLSCFVNVVNFCLFPPHLLVFVFFSKLFNLSAFQPEADLGEHWLVSGKGTLRQRRRRLQS